MKKVLLPLLLLFIMLQSYSQITMQGSIQRGSIPNSVGIYLKPSASFSQKDEAMTFALAIPATVLPAPSMGSSGVAPNTTGTVTGITGLQPDFILNNLGASYREVVTSIETVNGISYYIYTFIFSGTAVANHNWTARVEQQLFNIQFNGCTTNCKLSAPSLVNLPKGGTGNIAYWYFQPNTLGDITNYPAPFYANSQTLSPINGGSADGSSLSLLELTTQPTTCTAPAGLSAANITNTSALLSWNAVAGAKSYTLQWKAASASDWTTVSNFTTASYNINNLSPTTAYTFQVLSTCSDSISSTYSTPFTFTTTGLPCTVPTGTSATNISDTSAKLSWSPVSGAQSYTLRLKLPTTSAFVTITGLTTTTYSFNDLKPGMNYYFQVLSVCKDGSSTAFSNPFNFTTTGLPCTVPTGSSATNITDISAKLSWDPVSGAQSYTLRLKLPTTSVFTTITGLTTPACSFNDLKPGTNYYFQVLSVCKDGSSTAYSNPFNFTTTGLPCTVPTGSSATNITDMSAKLSWDPVSGAQSYTLRLKPPTTSVFTTITGLTTPAYSFNDLKPGTNYYFQVLSVCKDGSSTAYSNPFNFTTSQVTTISGAVTNTQHVNVNEPSAPKGANLKVNPNPVTGSGAIVNYQLVEDGKIRIQIFDVNNYRLQDQDLGYQVTGHYTYNLNNLGNLPMGSYIAILLQKGKIIARNRFVIMHK